MNQYKREQKKIAQHINIFQKFICMYYKER
jgi:hypothetical protein